MDSLIETNHLVNASGAIIASTPLIPSIVIVDSQQFSRDCLDQLLAGFSHAGLHVRFLASYHDMESVPHIDARIIIYHAHQHETMPQDLLDAVTESPIPVMVISDLEGSRLASLYRSALKEGVAGLMSTSDTCLSTLRAAIPFIINGGNFLPRDLLLQDVSDTPHRPAVSASCSLLTPRQNEVLELMRKGKPNKLIAHALGMSESTTKVHVRNIMRAFGAHNRTEAVCEANRMDRR
jgi:DNA-binding NarL/FixJ family response regulator